MTLSIYRTDIMSNKSFDIVQLLSVSILITRKVISRQQVIGAEPAPVVINCILFGIIVGQACNTFVSALFNLVQPIDYQEIIAAVLLN